MSHSSYLAQIETAISNIKKNSGREVEYMTMAMKMLDERKAGREEGRKEGVKEVAQRMLSHGLSPEEISGLTGLDLSEVEKLTRQ